MNERRTMFGVVLLLLQSCGGESDTASGGPTSASASGGPTSASASGGPTSASAGGGSGSGGTSATSASTSSGGAECSSIDNEADCEARADCHPVFEDAGTCDCAASGCCARFAFCAAGFSAECTGSPTCSMVAPYCEAPAFVVSHNGECYEGCVRAERCVGGTLCPCEPELCAEGEQMCLLNDECALATGPFGTGLCRSANGNCTECKCASPDTPIATANGQRLIRDLAVGDLVYSVHDGAIRLVPIRQVNRVSVTQHHVLRIEFASGAHFEMSAGHPTAQGLLLSDLAVGEAILGERVTSITEIAYQHPYTYDILPDSDTGSYFADGVLVGSTLHRQRPTASSSW